MVKDMVDIIKARVSNRKVGAVDAMLNTLFGKARNKIEQGEVEDGLDLVRSVLERGEDHAENVLRQEGVEGDITHKRVAELKDRVATAREMGDISEALDVVDEVEMWIKDKWSDGDS